MLARSGFAYACSTLRLRLRLSARSSLRLPLVGTLRRASPGSLLSNASAGYACLAFGFCRSGLVRPRVRNSRLGGVG